MTKGTGQDACGLHMTISVLILAGRDEEQFSVHFGFHVADSHLQGIKALVQRSLGDRCSCPVER